MEILRSSHLTGRDGTNCQIWVGYGMHEHDSTAEQSQFSQMLKYF